MEKLELYHIHIKGNHDKKWKLNKEIVISENFESKMLKRYNDFSTGVNLDDGTKINLYDYITKISNMPILDERVIPALLAQAYNISYYGNLFKRETAMETYRKDNCNNLPSRLHSMYLTEEKYVDYWIKNLTRNNEEYDLFRVEADGNIFKTNEQLIPEETGNYKYVYDASYNYWHPNFKKVPEEATEYLAQGKIKVLEKIKHS